MRKLIPLLISLFIAGQIYAEDEVSLTVDAPDVVVVGDQFRLTFTVNTQDADNFLAPSISGLSVLAGPYRSSGRNISVINGKMTNVSYLSYAYTLMAEKEGTFTIPAASIEVEGVKIFSNAFAIKVLPPDKSSSSNGNSNAQARGGNASRTQKAGTRIDDDDLFITATANKTKVYEQEAILLTYKVYTTVNLRQLYGKMPDLKGFHTQEVDLPQQKTFSLERYKDRNYTATVWSQYILFPQQTGKLEIPSITFEGIVAQRTAVSDDPFDAFFNGGGYVEVKKNIVTPKLTINVESLPDKPENFSGGVGEFTMTSSINSQEMKTNDAVTIKLSIKGSGNMKLLNAPDVKFPTDFEVYDPKVTNNFNITKNGLSGTFDVEYLAIPRHAGTFTIPAIEFTYFDLKTKTYKTLKSDSYTLKVAKGEGNADQVVANFTSKESVKVLGLDIRFIKLGDTSLKQKGNFFYGTMAYCLWYIVPLLIFIILIVFFHRQAAENANIVKMKNKKANKVATKRLKLAGKLLSENKKNEFYDEILKALWGYISDKLNIPVSQLSKDNIESKLSEYGVDALLIKEFIDALNECELARYAPGNENEAMDKVYTASVNIISKMENSIKR